MGDIDIIEVFFAHTIAPVIIAFLVTVGVLIFVGSLWIGFTLMLLPFYVAVGAAIPLISYRIGKKSGTRYRKSLARMNTYLLDSIIGLREILLFNQGNKRRKELSEIGENLTREEHKSRQQEGVIGGLTDFFILASLLTILIFGFQRLQKGTIALQEFIVVLITAVSSFGPLVTLATLSGDHKQTFAAANRIFTLLHEEPQVPDPVQTKQRKFSKLNSINLEDVSFTYPRGEQVLDRLSLNIFPNKKVALVGKSGSGKTTILRLLLRFYDPDSGTVKINGSDIRQN